MALDAGGGGGGGKGGGGGNSGDGAKFAAVAGISLISQVGNIYSSIVAQQIERDYRRQQLELSRELAEIQAKDAIIRGERSAEAAKIRTKLLIGKQRVSLAAQGIDIESGSALNIQQETAEFGAVDELTIRNNAWREAFGYRVQALQLGGQSAYTGLASNFAQRTTVATGGANFVSQTTIDAYRAGLFDKKRGGDK
jgi:hypothetical protein